MKLRFLLQSALALLLLAALAPGLAAQEVDYDEQQYQDYQNAVQEPDLAEREKKIRDFVKANPDLSLVKYAMQSLQQIVGTHYQQKDWAKVVSSAKTWLELDPDATQAHGLITEAAFQLQDFATVAEHGETFYDANPSSQMAYILAIAYQQLGQVGNFQEYAKVTLDSVEPANYIAGHFQMLVQLRNAAVTDGDWQNAAEYARHLLEGFEKANLPDSWNEYISKERPICIGVLGRQAYEIGRWSEAINQYQRLLSSTSDRNLQAEAYYYIGISNWRANKLDPAMESFARGSMFSGAPHRDACDKYLVTLYKSTHNGSTAGLDEYKERVTGRP